MGLDLLDVTFRIEKTFGVKLSSDELQALERDHDVVVGDLYELVLTKLNLRDAGRDSVRLNEYCWTWMRLALETATEVAADRIELGTALDTLFGRETRRARWQSLREACAYNMPELDYPQSVRVGGFLLAVGVVAIENLQIWPIPGAQWFWPLLGVIGVWMTAETYAKLLTICAPLRNRFPGRMKTVKDLCRTVLSMNYAALCRECDVSTNQPYPAVWEQLVELLAEALGVEPAKVTFRSRLFADLGAD